MPNEKLYESDELTRREKEVYEYFCKTGASVQELSEKFNLTVSTIKTHIENICRKKLLFGQNRKYQLLVGFWQKRTKVKYRKKPVEVLAVQWTGDNEDEIRNFMYGSNRYFDFIEDKVRIRTLEGNMFANINDYIIKGVSGEFYPCKPDIFEQTYDRIIINEEK